MRQAIVCPRPGLRAKSVRQRRLGSPCGFSLVETMIMLLILAVLVAMAIPKTQSAFHSYQLTSAVDAVTGIIQTTRYQAIMTGYPYQVMLNTNLTYQILSEVPPAANFTAVGSAVPISAAPVVLSAPTTFQFKPNGSVSAPVGAMTFTLAYMGVTKTITVSNYGSINVQ
jgi:type II secretory pathway pseudopilin PulG